MEKAEIIIIGAGAAGLMAAMELSARGCKVLVLEARDRTGGRIHTIPDINGKGPIELGPEFIHGQLPITIGLLRRAGQSFLPTGGQTWQFKDGKLYQTEHGVPGWDFFIQLLKEVKQDMPLLQFLDLCLAGTEYNALRESVIRYASGYDTADAADVSILALRDEWLAEEDAPQYRLTGGYGPLIQWMADEITRDGGSIRLKEVVTGIRWSAGSVQLTTEAGVSYQCRKVIITIPLAVLRAAPPDPGAIRFEPLLPLQQKALGQMSMGAIIKIVIQFRKAFWSGKKDLQFVLSDQEIPTWWTLMPDTRPVLTGWLGGPAARTLQHATDQELLASAFRSLAAIFKVSVPFLEAEMTAYNIANWTSDPYTRGSYTYFTVHTNEALDLLRTPVQNTIFFAGEAFYNGPLMGTVEAAFTSGKEVAETVLKSIVNPDGLSFNV